MRQLALVSIQISKTDERWCHSGCDYIRPTTRPPYCHLFSAGLHVDRGVHGQVLRHFECLEATRRAKQQGKEG